LASKRAKPRQRWWQRLLRLAVLLALLGGAAYVSLPWWLPRAWLRDVLARRLSQTAGASVRIAELDLTWGGGLELGGLTIDTSLQAGALPLASVSLLRADFSPLDLLRGKLAWMEMDSPRLYLRANDDGDVDLSPLSRLLKSDVITELISIHRAAVVLTLPYRVEPFNLDVGDVQILAGRFYPVGQLTLAAGLHQGASLAPVTFRFSEGPRDESLVGRAKLSFQGLDLEALGLPQVPWLPLRHFRRLSGLASGELELAATTEGKVNQFRLDINVARLDAQPAVGPELPVFEQAWIRLEAGFDFLSGRLDLHSAQVRLPGMDLTGGAVAYLDNLGQWDRISSVQVDGTVYPQQVAALFGGGKEPNDFQVTGPVAVHFTGREPNQARSAGPALQLTVGAVATGAELRRGDYVLKPAGRRLEVTLAGDLDANDWSYAAAGEQVVLLGGNEFRGTGTLSKLRQLTERWSAGGPDLPHPGHPAGGDRPWSAWDVPPDLSHLHWNGSWEIRDLPALAELWPAVGSLLAPVRLEGKITGECFIGQEEGNEIILHAALPRGTWLSVPGVLVKPVDQDARLVLAARLDGPRSQWNDIDLLARMGEASLHLHGGSLGLVGDDNAEPVLVAQGQWELLGLESLLKLVDSPAAAGLDLRGAMEGSGSIVIGPAAASGSIEVKADRAALRTGAWVKPELQPAYCTLQFSTQPSEAGWTHSRLSAQYRSPGGVISAKVAALPSADNARGNAGLARADCEFRADIEDAAWLVQSCPPLGRLLEGGRLSGPAHLAGGARWEGGDLDGNVSLDGAGLDLAAPGGAAVKRAGTPLAMRLEGALFYARAPSAAVKLDLRRLELAAANCTADLGGRCEIDPSAHVAGIGDLTRALPSATLSASFHVDRSAGDLVPDLLPALRQFGVDGQANGSCRLDVGGTIELKSSVELGGVCVAVPGGFSKPAGMPGRAQAIISLSRDLSSVDSLEVLASLGESNLAVEGKAKLALTGAGAPRLWQASGGLAVTVGDASQWATFLPLLAVYEPNGELRLTAQWNDESGFAVSKAEVQTAGLGAAYRGRRVSLAGDLQADGVTQVIATLQQVARAQAEGRSGLPARRSSDDGIGSRASTRTGPYGSPDLPDGATPPSPLRVARVSTDGLEFRADENHGWVVADVTGPLGAAPSGRVRVLAELLDVKDLADWLADPHAPGAAKTGEAGGACAVQLTPAEAQKLEDDARRGIALLRRAIERSELDIRFEIDRFRTFDADVCQAYEVRQMVIQAAASKGKLRMQMAAGIGGGTFRRTQETNLADENPAISCDTAFQEVLASQSTRAQLTRFFPGNTVNGSFDHSEKLTMPLSSAVANMIDPRAPLHASGPGETTAITGVMEGRAAPQFVTSIFPGLNTTRYNYNRMRAFTRQFPDGSAQSDMIFDGESYDLYMEGTTDPNNIARYETGIILLSRPQTPELNHDLKLGRVPLLKIKARIQGGKLYDTEVSYPWPNEALGTMFIRNNPFYRLWVTYHDK
jgi:hypothetical protein